MFISNPNLTVGDVANLVSSLKTTNQYSTARQHIINTYGNLVSIGLAVDIFNCLNPLSPTPMSQLRKAVGVTPPNIYRATAMLKAVGALL